MKLTATVSKFVLLKQATGLKFLSASKVLGQFSRNVGDRDIRGITPNSVNAFLRGQGPLTTTAALRYRILDGFFKFAIRRSYLAKSPLPNEEPHVQSTFTPHIYSIEELRRILAVVALKRKRYSEVPASSVRALILLAYGAGLRISEGITLTNEDVNLKDAVLTIREAKNNRDRLVPISQRLAAELSLYAHRRRRWPSGAARDSPFLAMLDGGALKIGSLDGIWRRACDSAGVRAPEGVAEQPRFHDLRHTFAVHRLIGWYREGADVQHLIYFLQIYLGHEHLSDTQRYLTMTPELLGHANKRFENYISREVGNV